MNKWYDDECKTLHRELRYAFTHSQTLYPDLEASYRRLLRHKKRLFVSHRRRELSSLLAHSPKQLWHTILPRRSPLPSDLDPTSMFSHTSNLYIIPRQGQIHVTSPPSSCYLFSNRDIREAIWVMNNSKEANEEGYQEVFFKHGFHALFSYLVDLFNHVVCEGFPPTWSHHIIHPIHKSSSNSNPNNYRTIMVGHTFSKLYAIVLHRKLSSDLEQRQLRARGQVSFQLAHQTIDHIFSLCAMIEEARHRSSKVYCCFVDFRKLLTLFQGKPYSRDSGILPSRRPYRQRLRTYMSLSLVVFAWLMVCLISSEVLLGLNRVVHYLLPCLGFILMSWRHFYTSISRTSMASFFTRS